MKIVADISNYDADHDASEPRWAFEFLAAGIEGVIVGSQWPTKSARQIDQAVAAGLPVIGTYAEPDAASAIALAHSCGAKFVGLACERGSIVSHAELVADVNAVRGAGLTPWIYGNAGDLVNIAGDLLRTELIWLANYGMDDPSAPRAPITEYDFGAYGVRKLAAHQFSSTAVIAGRVRDRSYWYPQEDEPMTPAETKEHEDLLLALFSGAEEGTLDRATRLGYARYRLGKFVDGADDGEKSPSIAEQLAELKK